MKGEFIGYGMKVLKGKSRRWNLSSLLVFGLVTAVFSVSANKQGCNIVFFKSATGELLGSLWRERQQVNKNLQDVIV